MASSRVFLLRGLARRAAFLAAAAVSTTLLLRLSTRRAWRLPPGPSFALAGTSSERRGVRMKCEGPRGLKLVRHVSPPAWLYLRESPDLEPAQGATVVPVFPLRVVGWPGCQLEIKVIEPAHRRLYQDLLMSGSRRLVAPLARLPDITKGQSLNKHTPDKFRRLHGLAPVLHLTELKEVSDQTDGVVKYIAKHIVVGRAQITRLLNPSSLFESDEKGAKINYLRAEANILPEEVEQGLPNGIYLRAQLARTWKTLRNLGETLDEPRMQSDEFIAEQVAESTSWKLADLWQRFALISGAHRARVHVAAQVRQWIERELSHDRISPTLASKMTAVFSAMPQKINYGHIVELGLPRDLALDVVRSQMGLTEMGSEFWESRLQILGTDSAEERLALLVQDGAEMVKNLRARSSLRSLLG